MKHYFSTFTFAVFCAVMQGQNTAPLTFHIELAQTVNMSSLPEDPWMTNLVNLEAKDHFANPDKSFLYQQKKKSALLYPRKKTSTPVTKSTNSVNPPVLNKGFNGNSSNGSVPLDNYLAVSDSFKIVSVTNTKVQVFDTGGTSLMLKTLSLFTSSLGLGGTSNSKFDPKVIYDPLEDKFITVILNGSKAAYSKIIVGFSQTNDPTGNWNFYTLPGNPYNDSTWLDYPSLNITQNELFITGNQVRENVSWQLGFKQSVIWQIRKKDGYAGNTLVTNLWNNTEYNGKKVRNLHPVKWGPDIEGPNQYFLSNRNFDIQNDTIFLMEITDTIGAPGVQLNVAAIVADKKYGVPPSVPQPGGSQYLATNDGRVLSGIYQNGKIQFASNSIDTATGRSAIYFGIIDGVDIQSYSLHGTLIANDTLEFGYPNMSWVGDGANGSQTIISFLHCSELRRAGVSALFYADGEFSDMITLVEGTGVLNALSDTIERWGDYSGSQPVYNRDGKMWMCGMYANSSNNYATWIAQMDNPFGAETSVPVNQPIQQNSKIYPNPGFSTVNLLFETPQSYNEVKITATDISGKTIGILYNGPVGKGKNVLGFETGHLAPGNYFIQLWAGDQLLQTHKFIHQ